MKLSHGYYVFTLVDKPAIMKLGLRCIFGPNLEIITAMGGELCRQQAQSGVKLDFQVQFDLEGHGQLPLKIIQT